MNLLTNCLIDYLLLVAIDEHDLVGNFGSPFGFY